MTTRVVYTPEAFAQQRAGGVSRYFAELHRHARCAGFESRLIGGLTQNEYLRGLPSTWSIRQPDFLPRWPAQVARKAVAKAVNQGLTLVDLNGWIVHKTYYNERRAPRRAKLVITVHDMIYELFPEYFDPADPTPARKRYWCERADLIFTDSDSTAQDLTRLLGVESSRVRTVRLGADHLPIAAPLNERTVPYVLYVGRRDLYKNFATAVHAVAALHRLGWTIELRCFGGGAWSTEERKLLSNLGVDRHVRLIGGADPELAAAYADAVALIYPSEYEGFGLPPVEAMRAGCPVVASDIPSLREVSGPGAVLVDPHDFDAYAAEISRLLSDNEHRATRVQLGQEHARPITWEAAAKSALDAYALMK